MRQLRVTPWLSELRALYARVDALYAGWSCPASTECCRFGITGRQPFVTTIELYAIRDALAHRGGPPSKRRRALPLARTTATDERTCPLLDRDQHCSVYADRPLGCRTFYCGRATRGEGPTTEELAALQAELSDLAARHSMAGEETRPLVAALG
jgi:Fe-S-cluster containining protein